MTVTVRRRYLEHSGGTKFYQLFAIERTAGPGAPTHSCTITHWGSLSIVSEKPPRPQRGGQTQLFGGTGEYDKKYHEKSRKGYQDFVSPVATPFNSDSQFINWLTTTIGRADADNVMELLGISAASGTPDEPATATPKRSREDQELDELSRPATWGTW